MNNKLLIPLVIAIVVVGAGAFYMLSSSPSQEQAMNQTQDSNNAAGTIEEGNDQMVDASDNPINNSDKYVEFSDAAMEEGLGKKRVIYFYANWCPTCKVANDEFTNEMSRIPDDVVVIRTNYNDDETDQGEKDLAAKYNITYQHTFVHIDENGNELAKWNGGAIDELIQRTN